MTLNKFLITNAILFVPFGAAMIFIPTILFPMFGIDLDSDGTLMARVFGSALLSIGLMCYLVRSEPLSSNGIKAILIGNFLFHATDAISTFLASFHGVMNTLGWMFFGLHAVLAVGFLYFLKKRNTALAKISS